MLITFFKILFFIYTTTLCRATNFGVSSACLANWQIAFIFTYLCLPWAAKSAAALAAVLRASDTIIAPAEK
jgi:hypothetical protein